MKNEKYLFWINTVFFILIFVFDILFMKFSNPYIFKTIPSVLFVLCGLVNFLFLFKAGVKDSSNKKFAIFMLTGLFFAMLGDIFLIETETFILGAGLFAVGHIFFFVSYIALTKYSWKDLLASVLIFIPSLLIILLYDGFVFKGIMMYVVIVYALIISLMLGKSIGNVFSNKLDRFSKILIFVGSLMFFLSDLCLLFYKFGNAGIIFDDLCLLLYYPAEFILSVSIYYVTAIKSGSLGIFKKIYCRIFQLVFRIALPILPYREPEILNSVVEIKNILKEKGITNVLLVTDKGVRGLGLTKELEDDLKDAKLNLSVYEDVIPNPTIKNIEECLEVYKNNKNQAIIAFGGGSVMDCAKVVGARVAKPNKSVKKMKGLLKICKSIPLLFAVPTTAGTGSEVTLAAVITDEKTHHKYPINDFCLIPKYAVLDYKTTINLPQSLTSTTGLDALTHAIEAYIGRSTTKFTREKAEESIKLIYDNLLEVYTNGKNAEARASMLKASYLAGIAFSRSYVGYVHAVAHSLGGKYRVPHGLANAVILPYFLEFYEPKIYKKLAKLAIIIGLCESSVDEKLASNKFIEWVKEINRKMNIPSKIQDLKEEDIPALAILAEKEANPLYPVPILLSAKELEKMYKNLLV